MTTLNLTRSMERLIGDIVIRVQELQHIDPHRVLVCVATTRGGGVHGTYAKIHPLRFAGGSSTMEMWRGKKKITYVMPSVTHQGRDILYVVYFLVPRFLNLSLREKLITIFHELYHISPEFDGDIRRFPGKTYAHGSSRKRYNELMARLVDGYVQRLEDDSLTGFLEGDLAAIRLRHKAVVGRKLAAPRIRVEKG
jgi:predicted metallopeptidase